MVGSMTGEPVFGISTDTDILLGDRGGATVFDRLQRRSLCD